MALELDTLQLLLRERRDPLRSAWLSFDEAWDLSPNGVSTEIAELSDDMSQALWDLLSAGIDSGSPEDVTSAADQALQRA